MYSLRFEKTTLAKQMNATAVLGASLSMFRVQKMAFLSSRGIDIVLFLNIAQHK